MYAGTLTKGNSNDAGKVVSQHHLVTKATCSPWHADNTQLQLLHLLSGDANVLPVSKDCTRHKNHPIKGEVLSQCRVAAVI